MVETTRETADGNRVRREQDGDETGDETGGPGGRDRRLVTNEIDGDWWGNVYGRRGVRI